MITFPPVFPVSILTRLVVSSPTIVVTRPPRRRPIHSLASDIATGARRPPKNETLALRQTGLPLRITPDRALDYAVSISPL